MDRINNIIADIMPKDLVLIDLEHDKSSIRIIVDSVKSVDLDTTAYIAKKIRNSESLNKYLPKDSFTTLNEIALINLPFLDTKRFEICLLLNTLTFLILSFSIKKRGFGFPVPKGSNLLISLNKYLFTALPDILAS